MEAIEPDAVLVEQHASELCRWYNAHDNASMMGGSGPMSREDVLDFWRDLRNAGGRGFLGFADGVLVGDGDLRGIHDGRAEFAVMIGNASEKGRGLGRTLALMIHVFGFRDLGLERVFVSPRRDNRRVHALNAWLGYERDDGEEARAYADEDSDPYSLSRERFLELHEAAWRDVRLEPLTLTTRTLRGTSEPGRLP